MNTELRITMAALTYNHLMNHNSQSPNDAYKLLYNHPMNTDLWITVCSSCTGNLQSLNELEFTITQW